DYSFPPRFDVYPDDFLEIEDDVLPSPDNEDKVFNLEILIHDRSVKIITRFAQEKKLAVSYVSWLFEDFDPPFYELLVFKEVPNSMRLLPFSSGNEEKVFKPGIYTFKKEAQNRVGNVNRGQARPGQARTVKCYNCNALDAEQLLFLVGGPNNAFDDDVDEQPVQDLALNVNNVFQAEDCDAFDLDVDEAPTAQTMLMANLSSADPITDEARPSYDSDILSE
nr:hypothetical protein [Tanacetum cinerariifolium]